MFFLEDIFSENVQSRGSGLVVTDCHVPGLAEVSLSACSRLKMKTEISNSVQCFSNLLEVIQRNVGIFLASPEEKSWLLYFNYKTP